MADSNVVQMFPEHPNNPSLHEMLVKELSHVDSDVNLLQAQILVLLKKRESIVHLLQGTLPDPSIGAWGKSEEVGTCRECGKKTRSLHPKGWFQHTVCPEENVSSRRDTKGVPAEVWKILLDEVDD